MNFRPNRSSFPVPLHWGQVHAIFTETIFDLGKISGLPAIITVHQRTATASGCVPAPRRSRRRDRGRVLGQIFTNVRQSQPHSRPISANGAPDSCKVRKRRMFIQDSESTIMSRVTLTQAEEGSTPRDRPTHQVVRRTTYEVVRGQGGVTPRIETAAVRDGAIWPRRQVHYLRGTGGPRRGLFCDPGLVR
jgi:hypothetical protein